MASISQKVKAARTRFDRAWRRLEKARVIEDRLILKVEAAHSRTKKAKEGWTIMRDRYNRVRDDARLPMVTGLED